MRALYLNSETEVNQLRCNSLSHENLHNPPTRTHQGKNYTYYGKAILKHDFCWKMSRLLL